MSSTAETPAARDRRVVERVHVLMAAYNMRARDAWALALAGEEA